MSTRAFTASWKPGTHAGPGELLKTFQSTFIGGRWLFVGAEVLESLVLLLEKALGPPADPRFSMKVGQLVALASCVRHSVFAEESCTFLLTLHQERFADVGL